MDSSKISIQHYSFGKIVAMYDYDYPQDKVRKYHEVMHNESNITRQ